MKTNMAFLPNKLHDGLPPHLGPLACYTPPEAIADKEAP